MRDRVVMTHFDLFWRRLFHDWFSPGVEPNIQLEFIAADMRDKCSEGIGNSRHSAPDLGRAAGRVLRFSSRFFELSVEPILQSAQDAIRDALRNDVGRLVTDLVVHRFEMINIEKDLCETMALQYAVSQVSFKRRESLLTQEPRLRI